MSPDGAFCVTTGQDRSIRFWARGDDLGECGSALLSSACRLLSRMCYVSASHSKSHLFLFPASSLPLPAAVFVEEEKERYMDALADRAAEGAHEQDSLAVGRANVESVKVGSVCFCGLTEGNFAAPRYSKI